VAWWREGVVRAAGEGDGAAAVMLVVMLADLLLGLRSCSGGMT
jgi:hypothetical protein